MNEEAKRCVEILRKATYKDTGYSCNACPIYLSCPSGTVEFDGICMIRKSADLIESLSAQLDQVTRERDAAVEDVKKAAITLCDVCGNHHTELGCSGNEGEEYTVMACTMFKWRGVEKEVEG